MFEWLYLPVLSAYHSFATYILEWGTPFRLLITWREKA